MSEHQRIAFRAIDGPVSPENLEYMYQQSSRADITPWSFANEYHHGDFGGNVLEMLRRGYDLHLHYANFGVRKLLIRLPRGLPNASDAKPYLGAEFVRFSRDKKGPAGALAIEPYLEPGDLDELWEFDALLERLLPLRAEIMDGDLRPLYLAHLAMACDQNHDPETTTEGPVPAGLDKLTDAQRALAEFYGLTDALIAAAAEALPELAARAEPRNQYTEWVQGLPPATKDAWLIEYLSDPQSNVRRTILAEFQNGRAASSWPTVIRGRTIAELEAAAETIHTDMKRKAAEKAAVLRAKKLAAMAADPEPTLRETEKLVKQRGAGAYAEVATLLADLRDALAGTAQAGLAEKQARKLKSKYPTLHTLTSELRRKGFVPK